MLLIYPGTRGEPVALQDVLREAHESLRAARAAQIESRKKRRVPLDDDTDWQAVGEARDSIIAAVAGRDSVKAAANARAIAELTEGNALEEIGAYEPSPELDGIVVTMQVVADADRRMWSAETAAQWQIVREARVAGDIVRAQTALNQLDVIAGKVVAAVVVALDGVEGLKPTVAESIPGLQIAGLMGPLYAAARHFLDLPSPKAVRCGLPPLST